MALLALIIDIYSLFVFAAVVLSWIRLPDDNPFVVFITRVTEPVLGPVRRLLPDLGGFDFSPMLVLMTLRLLRGLLASPEL